MGIRRASSLVAIVAAVVMTLAGVASCSKSRKQFPLEVALTADVRGRLVPCGCFTGQMGGLTRIAGVLGEEPNPNALRVDAGDAIEGPEDYHRIEYRYILEAFAEMHYDAVNMGHREASHPAGHLRAIKATSPVAMISANLLDAQTRAPILDTHRIVERGGWKIAIVGVMDAAIPEDALGEGLAVENAEAALGRLLPEIKSQADFVVLLAFVDEEKLKRLAETFYELDLILGGKVSQPSQRLEKVNDSLILYTTNESRALGKMSVTLDAPGQMTAQGGEVMLVHDRLPQAESIRALAQAYRDEVRTTKLQIDDPNRLDESFVPGVKLAATFVGSQSCVGCHPTAAKVWQDSAHGHAFKTLVDARADADPNCIGCHVVGFGTPSGYRREFGAKKLVDVGCESCHGPGSLHVEQRQKGGPLADNFRTLGAGDCQKCHHGEFSRPFVWEQFWPMVKHGKEGAAP